MFTRTALWVLVCLCLATPATAQNLLVETATFNPTSANPWEFGLSGMLSYGIRFHVDATTRVTSVGIGNLTGTGSFYAAIVPVGPSGFPAGAPFNDAEAIAHATFVAAGGDQRVPLSVTLTPGDYMLITGAGKYSTSGDGEIATAGQTTLGEPATYYSFHDGSWTPVFGSYTSGPDPLRFVVEGESEHRTLLDAVNTRASQGSVQAIATAVATRASQASVDGLSASVAAQYSSLFTQVGSRASQASVTSVAGTLALKASQASVDALAAGVASLSSSIATAADFEEMTTAVAAAANSVSTLPTQTDLAGISSALSAVVESRASQTSVDALTMRLTTDDSLRLEIERSLAVGQRLATFFLPSSAGGHLSLVRDVVDDAMTSAQQAGLDVRKPRAAFEKGEAALLSNDYKNAYDWYANAYQELIK